MSCVVQHGSAQKRPATYFLEIVRDEGLKLSIRISLRGDVTHSGFGMVELHTAGKAALCEEAELGYDQLVELSRRR
jgi:hypothetical protein